MKFTKSSIEPDNVSLSSNDYNMFFEEPEPKGWSSKPNENLLGLPPGPIYWHEEGGGRRTRKAKKNKRARKTKRLYKKI